MILLLLKSHVSGYTRADGTVVAPHEDKRVRHQGEKYKVSYLSDNATAGLVHGAESMYSVKTSPSGKPSVHYSPIDHLSKIKDFSVEHETVDGAVEAADRRIRRAHASLKGQAKYSKIPPTWDKDAKKAAKALIDAGYSIHFGQSTQSKSKYITVETDEKDVKVRLSDHNLPDKYDQPDVDFRYGGDVKALIDSVKAKLGSTLTKSYTPPTPAQAEAGNYKKPRVKWNGLEIAIENPVGSTREGKGWKTTMRNAYGYITRSEGVDGDEVDCYLGNDLDAPNVYVVHQRKYGDWQAYDEDKIMLGFPSETAARAAYLAHYDDKRFLGPITTMPVDEFVRKVKATKDKPAMIKCLLFLKSVA